MTTTGAPQCFAPTADNYDRMMGRYLPTLAPAFADAAGIFSDKRVLDVGSGPGGLTTELVRRLGANAVAAIDPTPPFVQACREGHPGVDVRQGVAEQLPFDDNSFDAALACLVVGFMTDPLAGVREMARVTKPGGVVAATFWDHTRMPALNVFWKSAARLDPQVPADVQRRGGRPGELGALLTEAGLVDVREGTVAATTTYESFDEWWAAYTLGVGPIGSYFGSLDDGRRAELRELCRVGLDRPEGAFTLQATAWFARGTASADSAP